MTLSTRYQRTRLWDARTRHDEPDGSSHGDATWFRRDTTEDASWVRTLAYGCLSIFFAAVACYIVARVILAWRGQ